MIRTTTDPYNVNDVVVILLQGEVVWPATVVHVAPERCRCGAARYVIEFECVGCDQWEPRMTGGPDDEDWATHVHSMILPAHELTTWCKDCGMPESEHVSGHGCSIPLTDDTGTPITLTDEQAHALGLTTPSRCGECGKTDTPLYLAMWGDPKTGESGEMHLCGPCSGRPE